MTQIDGRYLSIEVQEYLRQQAVRLRQAGKRFVDISEYLGVHRNTVSRWWQEYEEFGEEGLYQAVRGRQLGEHRSLSPEQERQVQQKLQAHFPEELGIDRALWTRAAVQALIEQACGVEMPIRTVGEYLRRWGYPPQRPLKRAYEQDPDAVEDWLEHTYPEIVQRAQQEGAEIAWGDESGLRSDANLTPRF
jgi:transposase